MIIRKLVVLVVIALCVVSCKKAPTFQSVEIALSDWSFRNANDKEWMKANVPGNLIDDLVANRQIDDPYNGSNADSLQWIGKEDWEYQTTFDVPMDILKNDKVSLHFAGLDTYADIFLNGKLIFTADNMFRSWDIPCKTQLKERGNQLRVYFHSRIKAETEKQKKLPYFQCIPSEEAPGQDPNHVFTRKSLMHYGWEGGPAIPTCGIWQKVTVRAWSNARIAEIDLNAKNVTNDSASYQAMFNIETIKGGKYNLACFIDDQPIGNPVDLDLKPGENRQTYEIVIDKPNLWWCNGMGTHHLYTLRVQISSENKIITEKSKTFGVRKIELIQEPDDFGRSFYFKLNDIPVFAKGAVFIAPDILTSRVTGKKYEQIVQSVAEANMNFLRIWGGGIYENDTLYELCDKNGILVWQDLMLANGIQSTDSSHIKNIKQEVIEQVKRLNGHSSIALWCGNNKGLENWKLDGWRNRYSNDIANKIWKEYESLYYTALPEIMKNYTPQTAYWPSTPSGFNNQVANNKSGDWHEWRVCYGIAPISLYNSKPGRFISEYGMQSFPGLRTLNSFTTEENLDLSSPAITYHQRLGLPWLSPTMDGNQMINDYIQMYYNNPADFESFVYLSQIMQSEALKTAIEAHRINKPRTMGSLFWHLNDCWPGITWSVIDYYGKKKPAYYTVKKAFTNITAVPKLAGSTVKIFVVSDTLAEMETRLRIRLIDFDGNKIGGHSRTVRLRRDTVQFIWSSKLTAICPQSMINKSCLIAQIVKDNKILSENILYFTDPKYLDLPIPEINYKVEGTGNHFNIIITSNKLAKNVVLDTFEKEAAFSDNNFDLLPERPVRLSVTYPGTRDELNDDLKVYSMINSY